MTSQGQFRQGSNVERFVKDNAMYKTAEEDSRGFHNMSQVAQWHTKQYRVLKCATHRMKGYDVDARNAGEQELHHQMALELKYAAKELVLTRRAKLKTLFENERLRYEAELNAMGLAVAKERF
uniref:Uncharacterized protein n=1 Tax=Polyblepharides amylifera TaxID=1486889 RepID=A0A7R9SVN2_9CHLO|mmetsp:Transcript_69/g.92  ORF Transcript_69/g.92 Transcript_69/m.92 type:complete len:123 (+) Transcript_69:291-659(+)|eukprot:CAMPEP_0196593424 /NCGR_PEP_ID=MMETSP1081-20130531/75593_1 /TAXON_ID=36882 /ORGANISM="Pyramimonas amylifera, Strain CCMP720" /LENGTH=122 /DNA_ID=CAMNT_0041917409 /DNA_START=271 /DNA_END=639 /DNA_ORIENTATION=+